MILTRTTKRYALGLIVLFSVSIIPIVAQAASALTIGQVEAVVGLLQAFGADTDIVTSVRTALMTSVNPSPEKSTSITQNKTVSPDGWVVVFTDRGIPIPQGVRSFLCDTALPSAVEWIDHQAALRNKASPISGATCLDGNITLSGDMLNGGTILAEGSTFNLPIEAKTVVNLLERDDRIKAAQFVTIIHYMDNQLQTVNFDYDSKYDFGFIQKSLLGTYYPELTVDNYSRQLSHEFMHKLGATDKYDGPTAACLINPRSGAQYDGYDIMCHRIPDGTGGYLTPHFSKLEVSDSTASEIEWFSYAASNIPSINLYATAPATMGQKTDITWLIENVSSCTGDTTDSSWFVSIPSGSVSLVQNTRNQTYSITCESSSGSITKSVSVTAQN